LKHHLISPDTGRGLEALGCPSSRVEQILSLAASERSLKSVDGSFLRINTTRNRTGRTIDLSLFARIEKRLETCGGKLIYGTTGHKCVDSAPDCQRNEMVQPPRLPVLASCTAKTILAGKVVCGVRRGVYHSRSWSESVPQSKHFSTTQRRQ
jgi:hypothetical protein